MPGDIPWTRNMTEEDLRERVLSERKHYLAEGDDDDNARPGGGGGRKRARYIARSSPRWGPRDAGASASVVGAQLPEVIPGGITAEQLECLALRVRIEETTRKLNRGELDVEHLPEGARSPPPVYDAQGRRTNTRDQRARDRLLAERQRLVEGAAALWPGFLPPPDFVPGAAKKTRKIPIPVDKYPDYNFIGLIIGPRGNTQKKMERETGAKISIRGKGSVKEGRLGRRDGQMNPGDDEPLHVLITADTDAQLEAASRIVSELVVPIAEEHNEHKKNQLRELALINGTLRDQLWHAQPAEEQSFERASVKCAVCGEVSHVTSDCPVRSRPREPPAPAQLQSEFELFMSQVAPDAPPPEDEHAQHEDDFISLMRSIGEEPHPQPRG